MKHFLVIRNNKITQVLNEVKAQKSAKDALELDIKNIYFLEVATPEDLYKEKEKPAEKPATKK